jgi:hypothetical protein
MMRVEYQIVCVMFILATCVAATRLIYHDGITGNKRRLLFDCRILAGMIIVLTFWSGNIGYHLQSLYDNKMEAKDKIIENLQAEQKEHGKKIANIHDHETANNQSQATDDTAGNPVSITSGRIEVTTPNGHKVSWTDTRSTGRSLRGGTSKRGHSDGGIFSGARNFTARDWGIVRLPGEPGTTVEHNY